MGEDLREAVHTGSGEHRGHDVFVSYSRSDGQTVVGLTERLAAAGKRVWVDLEDIPPSAEWMAEIRAAIESADGYLTVISPDLVRSPVCAEELAHAAEAGKRVVPVLVRATDPGSVPAALARLNWIDATDGDLDRAAAAIVRTLDTDLEHVKAHTRLLVRATEWANQGEDRSVLLRGRELADAEALIADADREPRPTQGQTRFVLASRRASGRRQRTVVGAVAVALVVSLILATVAVLQRGEALDQRRAAEQQATIARSRELSVSAIGGLDTDPELSVLLSVEAVRAARTDEAVEALRRALAESHVRTVLRGHTSMVATAEFEPDGSRVVTASFDGTARIWDAPTGEMIAELEGHTDAVVMGTFSPDGARVVTASYDGTARLWDAGGGEQLAVLRGHGAAVFAARFDPTGSLVVTAGQDGTARVWDAATGHELKVFRGHTRPVYDAAFGPDGRYLVTASDDGTARIWRVRTGETTAVLSGHAGGVYTAEFSPDGTRVLTAGEDGTARVWDASDGTSVSVFRAGEAALNGAAFSPDATSVVTAGEDGIARLWEADTGHLSAALRGHRGEVNDALFSPDGALVLTSGSDGTARVWSAASGQMLSMLRGHDGEILSGSFSSGGLAVTASEDGTARVWDPLSAGSILSDEEGFVARVAFTPDGDRIVTASDAGVRVWSRDGELLSTSGAEDAPYFDEALSPDGRLVAAGGASGTAYVWRVSTGHLVAELKGHEAQIVTGGIAFSPDGSRVVTGGFDETARLWDATSGEALQVFRGHVGVVFGVGFSPDGERIVTAGQDGTARVWDADTGEELLLLSVHMGQVTQAVFDPTGRLVATVGADDTGHLWNAETGELVTSFGGDGGAGMSGVSFSPDGRRLLTRSEDGTARVWDVRSGNEVLVLTGHEGVVWDASFDATGGRIVTVGADATVRVWDAGTGEPVAVFSDHQDEGTSAAIDPSGELVVSGDIVGSIWVNSCDVCGSVASLLDFADARATRDLDAEERSEYLHAPVRPVGPSPASVASPPPDAGRTLTDGLAEPDRYVVPLLRSAVALELDEGWMAFTFEDGSATGSTRVAQGIQLLRADDPAEGVTVLGVTRFVDGWKAWDEDHNLIAVGEDPIASFLDNPALRTFHVGKASVGGFVGDRVDTAFRVSPSIRTDPWPACGRSCAPIVPVFVDDDGRSVTDHDQIVASGAGSYDRWIVLDVGSEVVIVDIYAPTERFATFLRQVRTLLDSMSFDPPQP